MREVGASVRWVDKRSDSGMNKGSVFFPEAWPREEKG